MNKNTDRALFVIDMLNDFMNPKGSLFCGEHSLSIIENINHVVNFFHKKNHPVYFFCDSHEENDLEFKRFPPHAVEYTWGAEIIDGIGHDPTRDKIITKQRFSAFYNTGLEERLYFSEILPQKTEIMVVGVCTSICCLMTAVDLVSRDYKVVIDESCVADFDQEAHKFAIKYMNNILGVKSPDGYY